MAESPVLHELLLVFRIKGLQRPQVSGTYQHQLRIRVDVEGRGWVWLQSIAAVDDLETHLVTDFPHSELLQEYTVSACSGASLQGTGCPL